MGMVQRSGAVVFGAGPVNRGAHHAARLGLGFVPEDRRVFTDLTVMEPRRPARPVISLMAPTCRYGRERLFALFPNLVPQRLAARMSGGEQQMLTVAPR
jgi:branched-chain amino acid transport system ATP-binding protein